MAATSTLVVVQRTSKWPLQAVVNGVFHVLTNGCVWRDVPADFPPWSAVYDYFTKWTADGTWARVSGCLTIGAREREKKGRSPRRPSSTAKA